jgi:hypothetical protein
MPAIGDASETANDITEEKVRNDVMVFADP